MTEPGAQDAPPVTSLRHPLTRTLLVLTFTTGLVVAASYLGLGRVFAGALLLKTELVWPLAVGAALGTIALVLYRLRSPR